MDKEYLKFISMIGLFFIFIVSIIVINFHITQARNIETKLYVLELLMENKPKLENEELLIKVNEIYNIVSGK